jgi:hypothetical protein
MLTDHRFAFSFCYLLFAAIGLFAFCYSPPSVFV